ncbi:zinc finger protein [Reticulomyxa filosa]|uniref:Zinc finger protein n=1 Tax=Reticulomyxa filosa TaxID=46433 RepID=X6M031_RETFI|nr:zinc finger protein [Reticulomyxa filosa]|eukprot:ETO06757.1 zinc finger protein [Reticulomyxa filosa]
MKTLKKTTPGHKQHTKIHVEKGVPQNSYPFSMQPTMVPSSASSDQAASPVVFIVVLNNNETNVSNEKLLSTNKIPNSFEKVPETGLLDWVRDCPRIDELAKAEVDCPMCPAIGSEQCLKPSPAQANQYHTSDRNINNDEANHSLQQHKRNNNNLLVKKKQKQSAIFLFKKKKERKRGRRPEKKKKKCLNKKTNYLKKKKKKHRTQSIRGQIIERLQSVKPLTDNQKNPWMCPECHNRYATFNGLQSHFRIHTEWLTFFFFFTLKKKKKRNTTPKKKMCMSLCFRCDDCGHRFARSRDFQEHLRVHTNERPYVCRITRELTREKTFLSAIFAKKLLSIFIRATLGWIALPFALSIFVKQFRTAK